MLKPGYKQTEVGIIPEDWEVKPLRGLITILHGFPFLGHFFKSTGTYRLTTPGHFFEQGGFRDVGDKQKFYVGQFPSDYLLKKGDLIVAMTEQADGLLGSAALIPVNDIYLHNQRLGKIKPLSSEVYIKFLYHIFNGKNYRLKVRETAAGTKVKHTSPLKLLEIPIPLPPTLEEQRAIAEALSDADALIESLEQLIAKKRAIKQGAMQELLTGKRRLPGFDGEWENVLFSEMGKCYRGVSYNPTIDLYPYDNLSTVRLLRSNNIQDMEINVTDIQYVHFNKVSSEQYLRENDILICMANGSRDLVGKTGRFIEKDDFKYTFGAFMGCFRIYEDVINHNFVHYLFQTASYRYQISVLLAGSSINNLTPTSIESLTAYIPQDKSEQAAIATVLSDMDSEIAALEAKLNKAQQIKQGMMQELLTGKTRLLAASSSCPEPTDIPKQLEVSI